MTMQLIQVIFCFCSSFLLATLITLLKTTFRRRISGPDYKYRNLPPGHLGGWPFVGDTLSFMRPHSSISLGLCVEQQIARHGRIFKMNLFGSPAIVSADPDMNRFILQNEEKLFECSYPNIIENIMGKWSMLALSGDIHRRMRSISVNFIACLKHRPLFLSDIEDNTLSSISSWPEYSPFSAQDETQKFAFNIMVKHMMKMNSSSTEAKQLRKEYTSFMIGMASIPINLPGTAYRKALESRSKILRIIGDKLDERVKCIGEGTEGVEEDDLLALAVKSRYLNREQILDLMLTMLFAGHETSSAAISLAIYFLQACPQALLELREEHVKIAKQKAEMGENRLSWEDCKQMKFTNCVINETLRLGNIIKFLHRKVIRDVQFKGYDIPRNWKIIPILSAEHFDATIYDDPHQFNPWRWQIILNKASNNNAIMSFGGGPRMCPGAEVTKLKMAVFLHHLVQKCDWELAKQDHPISSPFLRFPNGLHIKIHHI